MTTTLNRSNLQNDSLQPGYMKGSLKWAIALTASLGAILEVIDTSIVNVALTDIQATLGATVSEVGWVVTGYAIANVVLIPLSAWLGDTFGKKTYFVFSMVGFTLASVLCGFAVNLPMLVISRILQGLFGGGLLAKAQAILFETFPPAEQGLAQAVFGVGVIAGPAIGPTLGGYLTDTLDLLHQSTDRHCCRDHGATVFASRSGQRQKDRSESRLARNWPTSSRCGQPADFFRRGRTK
jgi:MFS transporter, DHA2 family, multidrug resistance protein